MLENSEVKAARRRLLRKAINKVTEKYPFAKYVLICNLWFIRSEGVTISYGQPTPYEAWRNAASIIYDQT